MAGAGTLARRRKSTVEIKPHTNINTFRVLTAPAEYSREKRFYAISMIVVMSCALAISFAIRVVL